MIALIIIDQQKGIDHPKLGERNNPNAENEISNLLEVWRENEWPIYHVQHRSTEMESVFWPGQEGYEFKEKFKPKKSEPVIEKSVPCAFINSSLASDLKEININSLAIVGVATNNSVEATARTGGNLGFNVYVVEEACFTFAKTDYFGNFHTASTVHAMSLANLNGEYATVLSSEQLLSKAKI